MMNKKAQLLSKIIQYKSFRVTGYPKIMPMSLTISVTYHCNSRCKTCNVWKKKVNEFSLEEFDKTFESLGHNPFMFAMSGGEPFLRQDITEICQSAYIRCKPSIITIPTNGLLYDKISEKVSEIVEACPKTQIVVNLSVDGIEGKHDEIRGITGNFEKAMKTYESLKALDSENLELGIHTVISKFNVNDIANIYKYLSNLNDDKCFKYITEIAEERMELDTIGANITPMYEDYSMAVDYLSSELRKDRLSGLSKITQGLRLEYYQLVKDTLKEKRQVIPCYAGFASAQISPDGDIWQCCIKADPLGNLRDVDYNFGKIWLSDRAEIARKHVREGKCYCPMANASYTNMLCDLGTSIKIGLKQVI
jgi:MoaA/NifB/PqqE/SkfB family radical SAM enzyme